MPVTECMSCESVKKPDRLIESLDETYLLDTEKLLFETPGGVGSVDSLVAEAFNEGIRAIRVENQRMVGVLISLRDSLTPTPPTQEGTLPKDQRPFTIELDLYPDSLPEQVQDAPHGEVGLAVTQTPSLDWGEGPGPSLQSVGVSFEEAVQRIKRSDANERDHDFHRKQWLAHTSELFAKKAHQLSRSLKDEIMIFLGVPMRVKDPPKTSMSKFVTSAFFRTTAIGLACLNFIFVAYETNENLHNAYKRPIPPEEAWRLIVSITFTTLFTIEVALRIYGLRLSFVFGPTWRWDILDFLLVISAFIGIFSAVNASFARVLRFFRLARVLRALRVLRHFRSLRELLCALFWSMTILFWTGVMLVFVICLFAIFFMQCVTIYLEHAARGDDVAAELISAFGTIETAMITLFSAVSGGNDWFAVFRLLSHTGWYAKYGFLFYIFFMVFGVMSVLIGVFTNRAVQADCLDRELAVKGQEQATKHFIAEAKELFHEMHPDGGTEVTWQQFRDHVQNEEVMLYYMSQGLNILDARELFRLMDELDGDPSESMALQDFIMGMMRLTGNAKNCDLSSLRLEHARLMQECHLQTQLLLKLCGGTLQSAHVQSACAAQHKYATARHAYFV